MHLFSISGYAFLFESTLSDSTRLKLLISSRIVNSTSGSIEKIAFAVLDYGKSKTYPQNFLCLLPKSLGPRGIGLSKFCGIFGAESIHVAVELLTAALKDENNSEFKDEIRKRLKTLQPKPVTTANCAVCGCAFEAKRLGHYTQRVCQKCRSKYEPNQ